MPTLQNYEIRNQRIATQFEELRRSNPDELKAPLKFSWSNWGFGIEPLETSVRRLADCGVKYIELHGNIYGQDLGYDAREIKKILDGNGMAVSGICGMFSADNDMASNRGVIRQNAIDYIRRNVDLGHQVGAKYFLVVPGAVGRPGVIDDQEIFRSVETLRRVADFFVDSGIRAAIEPIRSAEVSIVHTVRDAIEYIGLVDHSGVQHINGDVYHMQSEESHIGAALIEAGGRLVNLHLADSNRCALGQGAMDFDTMIRALYCIGYNQGDCFVTPEPLGPGGDPYPAMFGKPDSETLDALVRQSVEYWNSRVEAVLG